MTRRSLPLLAALSAAALLVGCSNGPSGSAGANVSVRHALARDPAVGYAAAGRNAPCGWEKTASYQHVIWIWMENRAYQQVLGKSGAATRLRSFARACGTATNYDAISHPSLPNYIAATSGSTHAITNDCDPTDCPVPGDSLFGQLRHSGGWATYAEDMSHPCDRGSHGRYAARHNPAVYYTAIHTSCLRHDVAMGGTNGGFAHHLAAAHLPAFTFIAPNLCDDGHDCTTTSSADPWLGYWLRQITDSTLYRAGKTAVFVTWDEDDYGTSANQVATVVIAPTVVPGTRSPTHFTHYSLLRTTESLLHVGYLGAAATARSMRAAFNL